MVSSSTLRRGAIRPGGSGNYGLPPRSLALPAFVDGIDFLWVSSGTDSRKSGSGQHAQRSRMSSAVSGLRFVSVRHSPASPLPLFAGTGEGPAAQGASGVGSAGNSLAREAGVHASAGGVAAGRTSRAHGK